MDLGSGSAVSADFLESVLDQLAQLAQIQWTRYARISFIQRLDQFTAKQRVRMRAVDSGDITCTRCTEEGNSSVIGHFLKHLTGLCRTRLIQIPLKGPACSRRKAAVQEEYS